MPSETKSKFTALLGSADALAFDKLAYELRARTGRRVEKSEILRALIHLGLDHPPTSRALGEALDRRQPQADPLPEA
ncbi:hypothetical protein [Streptomyces sp. NPDC029003]|uniref:hypothetical protein n=1 Tax=Streptomyces sp. NPDC029003 TaxID=3155125 RepID=UPI003401A7F5